MNKVPPDNRKTQTSLVVITGCDTGIGKSLAELMIRRGYTVALSYLDVPPFKERPDLYQKRMDQRIPDEVEDFCLFVQTLCQNDTALDTLVCNAGIALAGPVENTPISMYRENFEVNYFSTVRIIQALIPELIKSRGRIVVNGSMAGKIALPFLSPYASSKFALEGFCDSLRREMKPFHVKTILLEPASVATPIWNKSYEQETSFVAEKYMDCLKNFQKMMLKSGNGGMSAESAARVIADIIMSKNPKACV